MCKCFAVRLARPGPRRMNSPRSECPIAETEPCSKYSYQCKAPYYRAGISFHPNPPLEQIEGSAMKIVDVVGPLTTISRPGRVDAAGKYWRSSLTRPASLQRPVTGTLLAYVAAGCGHTAAGLFMLMGSIPAHVRSTQGVHKIKGRVCWKLGQDM